MFLTLDNFKTFNNITDSSNDTTIVNCISASINHLEAYCNRGLQSGSYTDYKDGSGNRYFYLDAKYPTSITSIEEFDDNNYISTTYSGSTINSKANNFSLLNGYYFLDDVEYKVTYQAGYTSSNVPLDLYTVALELATHFFMNSGVQGVSRLGVKTLNMSSAVSEGTSYNSLIEMNDSWKLILDNYKLILV